MKRKLISVMLALFVGVVIQQLLWTTTITEPVTYQADCSGIQHVPMTTYPDFPPVGHIGFRYCFPVPLALLPIKQSQACSDICTHECGDDKACWIKCMKRRGCM